MSEEVSKPSTQSVQCKVVPVGELRQIFEELFEPRFKKEHVNLKERKERLDHALARYPTATLNVQASETSQN